MKKMLFLFLMLLSCGGDLSVDQTKSSATTAWISPNANGYSIQFVYI